MPKLAVPMVVVWLVLWKVARRFAVPGALAAAAIAVAIDPVDHAGATHLLPQLTWTTPRLTSARCSASGCRCSS